MTGGMLVQYARYSQPPESRAALFVESEKRLTWLSFFYAEFPNADVYMVGGTVRDIIIGRVPNDIDLVVRNVEPKVLEQWLLQHGAAEFVGRFGTFKFIPHGCGGSEPIDIALPRTEFIGNQHSSARDSMEVKFDATLSIKDDLARRDFTINAMAFDTRRSRLIDPFLGLNDLHAGLIQTVLVPEQRFFEDSTRILRGLRFASQLNFGIEQDTWRAMKANIDLLNSTQMQENGMHRYAVPRESIGREFLLGFMAHPVHTVEIWKESRALHLFMPQLAALETQMAQDAKSDYHKTLDILTLLHKRDVVSRYGLRQASPTLLLAGLLSHLEDGPEEAYEICTKLYFHQFPSDHRASIDCKRVFWLLKHLHTFKETDPASMRPSLFEKLFLNQRGAELLTLMHTHFIASGKHSIGRERLHTAAHIRSQLIRHIEHEGVDGMLPRLISGKDIKAAGIQPGPAYRDLIDRIRDAQLTRAIVNHDQAMNLLDAMIAEI